MVYEFVKVLSPRSLHQADEWLESVVEKNLSRLVISKDKTVRKASMAIVEVMNKNSKLDKWDKVGY
jgi:hypothetical protein